jgi:alpha-ketoglutarate-dependent taurine dioxygenase
VPQKIDLHFASARATRTTSQWPLCVESSTNSSNTLLDLTTPESRRLKDALLEYGAVLLRGFNISSPDEFKCFAREFSGRELFNYAGGASPRTHLSSHGLYTSTEYPPDIRIPLHNELSYSNLYPRFLFFWCVTPAGVGGETTLADSRKILKRIDPDIVARFKEKGVCYIRHLHAGRGTGYSWQDAFETDSHSEVENICHAIGAGYKWMSSDMLQVTQVCPATIFHPETGEEVWFNQADGFHSAFSAGDSPPRLESRFGDGSLIEIHDLRMIRKAIDAETVAHSWRQDDVVVIDNLLAAHGRLPFKGKRKIVLAMT